MGWRAVRGARGRVGVDGSRWTGGGAPALAPNSSPVRGPGFLDRLEPLTPLALPPPSPKGKEAWV